MVHRGRVSEEIFPTLTAMYNQIKVRRQGQVFCMEYFNLEYFHYGNALTIKNPFTRIINSLIYSLNEMTNLPKYLIIMPDKNLADYFKKVKFGVSLMLGIDTEWLVGQIDKAVERKIRCMIDVKPGSITPGEPKIIWVEMIQRPDVHMNLLKEKFNKILEDILATRKEAYIMEADNYLDQHMFSRIGLLNHTGRYNYWKAVDEKIKKFDQGEIDLQPRAATENSTTYRNEENIGSTIECRTSWNGPKTCRSYVNKNYDTYGRK